MHIKEHTGRGLRAKLARLIAGAGMVCVGASMSCADEYDVSGSGINASFRSAQPVGLAIEIDNGVPVPMRVAAGQTFFIDQIDLIATVSGNVDRGVAGLDQEGAFADLTWGKPRLRDEEFLVLPNPDGTFTRRRFYRDAAWMLRPSTISVEQIDSDGYSIQQTAYRIGPDHRQLADESFFIRRMRAIQWTLDCPGERDCEGAENYTEEALVELRHLRDRQPVELSPSTVGLRVTWSLLPESSFMVPVEQVEVPAYDYGFNIELTPVTQPGPDNTYSPGTDISFQITLEDGSGNRLHPEGSLPTYNEVVFGENEPGIQYYRAFFDPTITYYRRKHRERMMIAQIIGPAQDVQPIRTILELDQFFTPEDVQYVGDVERDGVFAAYMTFPPARDLFGGAFIPESNGWDAPVSDTWTYRVPENARPGTYTVTAKGRRVYLGQDIPFTRTIELQIGTPAHTEAPVTTGRCSSCHSSGGELSTILHANDDPATCSGCHTPLAFEFDAPVFVRSHFIHSRSNRFSAPLTQCSTCHLTAESIQRTSKAACLSCHTSYNTSHVEAYGPIENPYVGGGRESFDSCTTTCHTTHPGSGL